MLRTGPKRFFFATLMALVAFLPQAAFGMVEDTPYAALARFASALSKGDGLAAMAAFDPDLKGYGALDASVQALVSQADVLCSIEVLQETAKDADRVLDTDWYLQIKSQADDGPTERRRERISVSMRLEAGAWRIVALSSTTILAPINIR